MGRQAIWLSVILFAGALLRLPALWWGLPPAIPHVVASDIRCSYAFDEDDVLTAVSLSNPSHGDLDPRDYHWGTLHLHLLQFWMDGAEAAGAFGRTWRDAYYHMVPNAFERVYAAGRLLSLLMALVSIALVFLLGREAAGGAAGLWAAALVAVSPAHVLGSVQIRVDMTMLVLVVLTLWLCLKSLRPGSMALLALMGGAAGLAVAAKYIAALTVLPAMLAVLVMRRGRPGAWAVAAGATAAGFMLGQPYVLVKPDETFQSAFRVLEANTSVPPRFAISAPVLLAKQASNAARFSAGLPAFILAIVGIAWMLRRRKAPEVVLACALAGGVAALVPLAWPLLRYQLPLLPFLAVAAALVLVRLRPAPQAVAGALALAFPLFASLAQVSYMRAPHPANLALSAILNQAPPGVAIARLAAELPPLDRKVYPMGRNPFLDDLAADPPEWVLTADLPEQPYPGANLRTLAEQYELRGGFEIPRRFPWASLGESGAPHDWKYTHARMALYRRLDR
jgi:hypothetical protein